MTHPLVKLLRWCRENVPDGRVSLCRVENISPCRDVCGPCLSVERRAKAIERRADEAAPPPNKP